MSQPTRNPRVRKPSVRNAHLRLPANHDSKMWFSPTDIAIIMNTSVQTIDRWMKDDKIAVFKEGRVIRVHRDHLQRFIRSHMTTAS